MSLLKQIDKAANDYHKTKKEKYKKLWYKLIKQFAQQSKNKEL